MHNTSNQDETRWLAASVESSDDAIISKDLNGIILSWNAGAQRLFGFKPDEVIGRPVEMIIPPELIEEEQEILRRLRNGERIDHFETVRRAKDGSRVRVSVTISPVRDCQGRVIGASKIVRDITERKRIEEAFDEAGLSTRLMQVQDEERRRIARELHDGVGQMLAALSMNNSKVMKELATLSPAAARCVEESSSLIEQASAEIRTMSYLLHPPMLEEVGLQSALQWYIDGFAERSKIGVALEIPSDLGRLPQECELSLFRIIQECLTNVHRHSGSFRALVRLSHTNGGIELEVKDEGRGIDQKTQLKIASGGSVGVGLRGMHERVRQIGGTLRVQSNGNGTSVLVTLPLAQERTMAV